MMMINKYIMMSIIYTAGQRIIHNSEVSVIFLSRFNKIHAFAKVSVILDQ